MASNKLNNLFAELVVSPNALDIAIEFINDNLDPGDVFDEKQLATWAEAWAESNGYTKS